MRQPKAGQVSHLSVQINLEYKHIGLLNVHD